MYHSDEQLWRKTRPVVLDAYARQFRKDLLLFLECRAQEMVPGGRLIVSLIGTQSSASACDASAEHTRELIARILDDMASRGVLDKPKLKAFYIPSYSPSEKEVKEIIEEQGSFSIDQLQVHDLIAGVNKAVISPNMIAYGLRAVFEPIIVDHFGSSRELMDEFISTAEKLLSKAGSQNKFAKNPRVFLALSLERQS